MQFELGDIDNKNLGDMPLDEFRKHGYAAIDWVCQYIQNIETFPVLSKKKPGEVKAGLKDAQYSAGIPVEKIFDNFENHILPGITHWNHPNFNAYFSNTGSLPGILAEIFVAALNINGMLWKTSPSASELEEVLMQQMKKMLRIPDEFFGFIIDTASTATFTALVVARESLAGTDIRVKGITGMKNPAPLTIYCSEHAHSSVQKAAIALGTGIENVKKIKSDNEFSMIPGELNKAISKDKKKGARPFAVVSTVGTTSTTSIDPFNEIGEICRKHKIWHHLDSAYAGCTAMLEEYASVFKGFQNVDSYVTNPHKWMFTPMDTSLLFFKDHERAKQAFSIVPEYLKTSESEEVKDYMNYSLQLGRRFRALKLWFVISYYGEEGIKNRLREHIRIARLFRTFVETHPDFELMAPTHFSVVSFRYNPDGNHCEENTLTEKNGLLLEKINTSGKLYISHSMINGKYILRYAIGNIRTTESHVKKSWELITEIAATIT